MTRSRVLIAECKQEVSTFNPVPSHLGGFRVVRGASMAEYHRGVREEVGGALSVFDDADVEVVPTYGASSITSGGVLDQQSFDRLSQQFLNDLVDAQSQPADGCYFSLHGAMQAEDEFDPEGYLLEESRRILGDSVPIVVSLDLHGILTDRMLQHADAVVIYHTYPHVDFFETGQRAANLLMRMITSDVRPVTARVKIPVLARGDEMITDSGAIRDCIDQAKRIEASAGGLSAGVMWGNPFTDVPELRSNAVVVMDGDADAARQHAIDLAERFWRHHEQMQVPLTSLQASVRRCVKRFEETGSDGTIVLMDAADATSSGASGDSNAIVSELVRQGYQGSVLAPVVDEPAVQAAFSAGVGATVRTTIGGALDSRRFEPLELECQVRSLSDGKFRSESFGWHWDSGKTAVLSAGNLTLIVGSQPVSLFDRSWFFANGQDPKHFDVVIVKSPHCEPHMFADWCAEQIDVDAPGSTSANVRGLGHSNCARPIFPLDDDVPFDATADFFSRSGQ